MKNFRHKTQRTKSRSNSNRLAFRLAMTFPTWPKRNQNRTRKEKFFITNECFTYDRRENENADHITADGKNRPRKRKEKNEKLRLDLFDKKNFLLFFADRHGFLLTNNNRNDKNSEQMNADEKSVAKKRKIDVNKWENIFDLPFICEVFQPSNFEEKKKKDTKTKAKSKNKRNSRLVSSNFFSKRTKWENFNRLTANSFRVVVNHRSLSMLMLTNKDNGDTFLSIEKNCPQVLDTTNNQRNLQLLRP